MNELIQKVIDAFIKNEMGHEEMSALQASDVPVGRYESDGVILVIHSDRKISITRL